MKRTFRRILWAISPEEDPREAQSRLLETLAGLAPAFDATIEPATVLLPDEILSPDTDRHLAAIESWLAESPQRYREPLKKLYARGASDAAAVQALLDYATHSGVDLIVVSTHGRRGMDRWELGSFAEALLTRSPLPVLIRNPFRSTQSRTKIRRVLFPTDFSARSDAALQSAVELAQALSASLIVFHEAGSAELAAAVGTSLPWPAADDQIRDASERAIPTLEYARQRGVRTSLHIGGDNRRPPEAIAAVATETGADLIVMESHGGPVASPLLGSISRQLARHTGCPILLLRNE